MLLRVPDYYKEFHCIAKECKHNCCIGWEIDVDEDTYEYYQSIPGDFGERLRKSLDNKEKDENKFVLKDNRCPFLNSMNLCDICIQLGEESLCEICTEYPRFTTEYANVTEKCLGLSCEEVCRIVLEKKDKTTIMDIEMGDVNDEWEQEDSESARASLFLQIRCYALELLQNRKFKMNDRLRQYLEFCHAMQVMMNDKNKIFVDEDVKSTYEKIFKDIEISPIAKNDSARKAQSFLIRLKQYSELEILNEDWPNYLAEMNTFRQDRSNNELSEQWKLFCGTQEFELELEQLAVYFTIRYFMRCIYTNDLFSQACFTVESLLFIKDMIKVDFFKKNNEQQKKDRGELARLYSSEVEHSQENIEQIQEWFLYEEEFSKQVLLYTLTQEE